MTTYMFEDEIDMIWTIHEVDLFQRYGVPCWIHKLQ